MIRGSRRVVGSLFAAFALGASLAAPAAAKDEVSIDHVQSEDGKASVVVSVDGVPRGSDFTADTVGVKVDDTPVEATVSSSIRGKVQRRTVLLLDVSGSMRGGRFDAAVNAANAYLDAAPADVELGLVTFSGTVHNEVAPTLDRDEVRQAIREATLDEGTAVYDASERGLELLGTEGSRSLLVLSDGADTDSSTSANDVQRVATESEVIVDVISLAATRHTEALNAVAKATGGKVIGANPASLQRVFEQQARSLDAQVLVEFDVPEGKDGEVELEVGVQAANGQHYTDTALVNLDGASALSDIQLMDTGKSLVGKPMFLLGAVALAAGLFGLVWIAVSGPNRSKAESRLDAYFSGDKKGEKQKRQASAQVATMRAQAIAVADRVVSQDMETKISQRLIGAGSAFTAAEWVLLHAGITVGAAAVMFFMGGPASMFLGLILGAVGPWLYLRMKHDRRLAKFNAQLPETLGLMAGGLQAGLSLPQSVDTVIREGREPMAGELRRALVEQRLGVDITDALESVGERMESQDFGWIVMAVRIQREVGGNLAEILHTVADTLREREYLRRQVRALSAEGRLSGYILVGLPPLIFIYMLFVNREYAQLLYTTFFGLVLSGMAVLLLIIGSWAMSKVAKVEV